MSYMENIPETGMPKDESSVTPKKSYIDRIPWLNKILRRSQADSQNGAHMAKPLADTAPSVDSGQPMTGVGSEVVPGQPEETAVLSELQQQMATQINSPVPGARPPSPIVEASGSTPPPTATVEATTQTPPQDGNQEAA